MGGPAFLRGEESACPAVPPSEENAEQIGDCERRAKTRMYVTKGSASESIDPSHYSSLGHLACVTGWVQQLPSNCRLPKDLQRKDGSLLSDEIVAAETFWIKQAQAKAFLNGKNEGSLTRLNP